MTKLFEILGTFFAGTTLIVYICIFLGKILEVTLCTLRIVLINRGERAIGALLALIEITLWLIIAGNVLSNYQSDPWKMVAYALAYSLGNYAGSWLEERLAFGLFLDLRPALWRMYPPRRLLTSLTVITALGATELIISMASGASLRRRVDMSIYLSVSSLP